MKELKVQPIRNGTVIDHIAPGQALRVLRILNLPRAGGTSSILAAMNVPTSRGTAVKDILKIEDREIDEREVSKIALIAPNATINIVRDYEVTRKDVVRLPEKVHGVVKCPNPNCITNHEPMQSTFLVTRAAPVELQCGYCDRVLADVGEHVT